MKRHINDTEILLLGNSHIEEGLMPQVINHHCYNFAMAGRDLIYEVELAKRYLPQMEKLKIIVMPLDYHFFVLGRYLDNPYEKKDKKLEDSFVRTKKCMYYKYMGLRVDEFWYWSEFLNSSDKFLNRFWTKEEDIVPCDSLGYVKLSLEKRRKDWEAIALAPYIDETKSRDEKSYSQLKQYYCTIADLAKMKDAKLVLLDVPMYRTFRVSVKESILNERRAFVEEIRQDYDNIYFYEFMNDSRFSADDFADASHLSENGAVKLSMMVKDTIEELLRNE